MEHGEGDEAVEANTGPQPASGRCPAHWIYSLSRWQHTGGLQPHSVLPPSLTALLGSSPGGPSPRAQPTPNTGEDDWRHGSHNCAPARGASTTKKENSQRWQECGEGGTHTVMINSVHTAMANSPNSAFPIPPATTITAGTEHCPCVHSPTHVCIPHAFTPLQQPPYCHCPDRKLAHRG